MRTAFLQEMTSQAAEREEIFLVVGDLGFSVVEEFADRFPDRFLNAGVAEQNMTGLAAGLASEGYHVFTYSIANFPTLRCLEQIRNDVCYHNLPVTVVAVGAGLAYGNLGYSHHGVQDIAALAAMPNLTLLAPADPGEARAATRHLLDHPGPSYLRLGKAGEAELHDETFAPLIAVRENREAELAIVATGSILREALAAADRLGEEHALPVDVWSCPQLSPPITEGLTPLRQYQRIYTLEEHAYAGGLGDFLRRNLHHSLFVHSFAVAPCLADEVGDQNYLRTKAGLDGRNVASVVLSHESGGTRGQATGG